MNEFFGEVISSYTEAQGIEDGMFVPADEKRFPKCLFTHAVHEAILTEAEKSGRTRSQVVVPLMMDVISTIRNHPGETLYTGSGLDGNATGQTLWIATNGIGGLTVMFPSDY